MSAISLDNIVSTIGDCIFLRDLGFGSFGRTKLGKVEITLPDKTTGFIPVVYKEIDPKYVVEVCGVSCTQLILQECSLLQQTRHPNLVRTFTAFIEDGKLYNFTEYCNEGSLRAIIDSRKGKPINENRIQQWFGQLAHAISFLHDKQILHCAIKPENILSTANFTNLKLSDAGTANLFFNTQKDVVNEAVANTLCHYPPEVFTTQDERKGSAIDIWMLGTVIYECLTLKLPFPCKDLSGDDIKNGILHTEPPPIDESYSEAVRSLVVKMLVKNPDERIELGDILDDEYLEKVSVNTSGARRLKAGAIRKGSLVPTAEQIQKHVKEMEKLAFHRKWSRAPNRTLLKSTPSYVRAVLPLTVGRDKYESMFLVCAEGELLFLSPLDNYESIHFTSRVFIDTDPNNHKDKFGIFHAVYDDISDCLFFVLINPHREVVFYATREEITPERLEIKSTLKARLKIFTPTSQTDQRQFWGLAISQSDRILFAGSNKDITMWSLPTPGKLKEATTSQLLGVLRCDDVEGSIQIEPRYLAYTNVHQPKLAVSDYVNNRIILFFFKKKVYKEDKKTSDQTEEPLDEQSPNTETAEEEIDENIGPSIPKIDTKKVLASKQNEFPQEMGSVYGPCDLLFDSSGNLLCCDYSNKRIQMFTFRSDSEKMARKFKRDNPDGEIDIVKTLLRGIWISDRINGGPYRIGIVKGIEPIMVLTQNSVYEVLCFR